MIELQSLRYVQAAVETGSFSRAAERFGVKQSTLSKGILHLESRLGLVLFARSSRGASPTESGRWFVHRLRAIFDDIDRLLSDAHSFALGETGTLRIGFHASLTRGALTATLQTFRAQHPDIELDAREASRSELIAAVERGDLDLVVTTGTPAIEAGHSLQLGSEPLVAALPPDHPQALADHLVWSDLRDAEFIVSAHDPGPEVASIIAARVSGWGDIPSIRLQQVGRDNLLSLVGGNRVAISTGFLAPRGPAAPALHYIRDAFGKTAIDQCAVWRLDNNSRALSTFLTLMAERHGHALDA